MAATGDLIVKGKFSQSWGIVIIVGLIGLLFVAAGIYFLIGGNVDIFYYPLLVGLVTVGVAAIFFGRGGSFELTRSEIRGKRRMGSAWSHPLEEIGKITLEEEGIQLFDAKGKKLRSMPHVSPQRAAGAVWMFHQYREKLPLSCLQGVGDKYNKKNLPEGLRVATRTFSKAGSPNLADYGSLVQYGDRYLYLPETRTESPGNALVSMVSPVIITRFVETPGIPNRYLLPIFPVVKAIHASALPDEEKKSYLGILAMTHLGTSAGAGDLDPSGQIRMNLEDGTELSIAFD